MNIFTVKSLYNTVRRIVGFGACENDPINLVGVIAFSKMIHIKALVFSFFGVKIIMLIKKLDSLGLFLFLFFSSLIVERFGSLGNRGGGGGVLILGRFRVGSL